MRAIATADKATKTNDPRWSAEERSVRRFWKGKMSPYGEIRLTVRLRAPADGEADVAISVIDDPDNPWLKHDEIIRSLYDGIHEGVAHAGLALPEKGLEFEIAEVEVRPPLPKRSRSDRVTSIAAVLRDMAATSAEGLWIGLSDPPATSVA